MMVYSQSYYEDIRCRLRGLLEALAGLLPVDTFHFVSEELDANEFGLSLEVLVDELEETGTEVPWGVVSELAALADDMGMSINVRARLRGQCIGGGAS